METQALYNHLTQKYPTIEVSVVGKADAGVALDDAPDHVVQIVHKDCGIVDPFTSECGRFVVDPALVYGIEIADAQLMRDHNKVVN
jgi:hypothetical protein